MVALCKSQNEHKAQYCHSPSFLILISPMSYREDFRKSPLDRRSDQSCSADWLYAKVPLSSRTVTLLAKLKLESHSLWKCPSQVQGRRKGCRISRQRPVVHRKPPNQGWLCRSCRRTCCHMSHSPVHHHRSDHPGLGSSTGCWAAALLGALWYCAPASNMRTLIFCIKLLPCKFEIA